MVLRLVVRLRNSPFPIGPHKAPKYSYDSCRFLLNDSLYIRYN